ncbi:MAG: sensor histidine kinase [Ilumatobacter sp.]|nr:sensor histidine kinase [Ilumatobacter sp.]
MREFLRSVLTAPRVPAPPPRTRWDWALVAALAALSLLEGVLNDDMVWRQLAVALGVVMPFATLARRSHPLAMIALVFAVMGPINVTSVLLVDVPVGMANIALTVLILIYAAFRWGSGRGAITALVIVLATLAVIDALDPAVDLAQSVTGAFPWLIAAAVGTTMRARADARASAIDQARVREREQLARELHDSVAHHVSAIAIQAQAGLAVAASQPEAAADALQVIEAAASRTLTEMRMMVTALRADEAADSTPARCLADVARLADTTPGAQAVDVELTGDLDDLSPSIEASLYRIAQESITNARRHARHATRVSVRIRGDDDAVRLTVTDDGDPVTREFAPTGFGLVGMGERATLLGGDLRVGPGPDRGWVVDAVLPRGRSAP